MLAPPSLANVSPACSAKLFTSDRFTATARTPIATPTPARRPDGDHAPALGERHREQQQAEHQRVDGAHRAEHVQQGSRA